MILVIPSYASADSPFHFNKAAKENPEINDNFDIVYFGETPQGEYVEFWIQVRDEIDTTPENGYINAYIINIYGNDTYEFGIVWWNSNGSITQKAWLTKGGNTNILGRKDYSISVNRLIFYIPVSILSEVKDEYHLTVTTMHIEYSSNSIISDTADYIYNPYEYPEEPQSNSYLLPILGVILIIVVIALIFSVLKKRE